MKKTVLSSFRFSVLLALIFINIPISSYATHIYGVDIWYTWVGGNTYTVNMAIYGDCSASSITFGYLYTGTPEIQVFNDNVSTSSPYTTIHLNPGTPQGVEVTPVCAAQASNTACNGGNIPGVKKFIYSANVTLNTTSTAWRFHYDGNNGTGVPQAGRSGGIINISGAGNTIIGVDATLNNSGQTNSSVTYTTIPTPFFCVNQPASFNPGAIDPNTDSLSFTLVAGYDNSPTVLAPVSYVSPATATNPLYLSAGALIFSSSTGQMNFTPSAQKSLVVYKVSEYRNGVLVGTSQREMTFVVLQNCSTYPPKGVISNASGGGVTVVDSTDLNACSSQGSFSFQINPTDSSGANITITYAGLPGGATLTITGNGTPTPHSTFSWNTTSVTPGTYTFFVTLQDDNCPLSSKQTIAFTVTVLPDPTNVYSLITPATCIAKAVFHVTPGGGPAPYKIKILQGPTTIQTINPVNSTITDSLVPGTYTISVINSNNCYKDTIITIASPPVIIPAVSMTLPFCPGSNTGSITITASGGLAPFKYAIGTAAFSSINTFSSLPAGTYALHIKDANFCIKDTTVNLLGPPPIQMDLGIKRPSCNHFQNGSITVSAYNTYTPYNYAIGAGAFSANNYFSNLAAGSYIIHIKDGHNCLKDTTINLADSLRINSTFVLTNILCHGDTSGTIVVNPSGGFGSPYTYAINLGSAGTGNIFTPLPAGTYTIHIKDDSLCYLDTNINLTQPAALAIMPVVTNVQCYGTPTGQIVVNPTGGVSPYSYSINGGSYVTSNTFTGLTPGSYVINVADFNNCSKSDTLNVISPAQLAITSVVVTNAACNGLANGSLTVGASGGVTPYFYAVNAGSYGTSNLISGLAAGTYILHLKDANGCIKDSSSFTITQPTAIVPSVSLVNSTCHTLSNGHVNLSASGGTLSYTYAVGSGTYSSSPSFTGLAAGTYTFHIKDANSCIKDTIITVIDSLNITGTANITPALCYNQSSGIINMAGSGGTSPYTYAMGFGPYTVNNIFSNILAGTYVIHIKDSNGCIKDTTVAVTQPTVIVPQLTIISPSCYGYSDGVVTANASGGTPSFIYAINAGFFSATNIFGGLPMGIDTIHVKDNNGCLHDTVFAISQPTPLKIDSLILSNVKCFGDNSGWVKVYVSGASPSYTYAANSNSFQASGLLAGLYAGRQMVHIQDSHNCPLDSAVILTQPEQLAFAVDSFLNPTCEAYRNAFISLHATGGTPQYLYANTDTTQYSVKSAYAQLAEGSYIFYIKDKNNCIYDTAVKFVGYPHIVIQDVVFKNPVCYSFKEGSITLDVTGGMQPLLYRMKDSVALFASSVFGGLKAGTYAITIIDTKQCSKDTTINLTQPDSISITASLSPNDCQGIDNSGAIDINVTGGVTPYRYLWSSDPTVTGTHLSGMPNGNYMVWVRDANDCADSLLSSIQYDDCCKPFVPDAFTPNGDGLNDLFRVRFKGDMQLIDFSIYNRYGERVYNSIYIGQGWDGTLNGVPQDMGVYNYYLKAVCGNKGDHIISMHGNLTLIR